MSDLHSVCYLLPEQLRFILFLVRWIRRIWEGNHDLKPDQISKVNAILDVLEGWIPFDAGTGLLRLEISKFGRMEVRVEPRFIRVRFWAWHPVASEMRPCIVLFVSGSTVWLADSTVQDCVRRLLKRADCRPGPDFYDEGRLQVKWQWSTPPPSPTPHWVELREQARKQGVTPPRAIHWLRDIKVPSSSTPSTTMKQVQHG